MATIVYRAGRRDGPSFDSKENINEGNFYLSIHGSCIYTIIFYVSNKLIGIKYPP